MTNLYLNNSNNGTLIRLNFGYAGSDRTNEWVFDLTEWFSGDEAIKRCADGEYYTADNAEFDYWARVAEDLEAVEKIDRAIRENQPERYAEYLDECEDAVRNSLNDVAEYAFALKDCAENFSK